MTRVPRHGRISPGQYDRMAPNLPASVLPALRLLVDHPPVRAAGRYDDDGGETDEFDHLFGPGPAADRHEARRIAARAALSDEDVYALLYPGGQ